MTWLRGREITAIICSGFGVFPGMKLLSGGSWEAGGGGSEHRSDLIFEHADDLDTLFDRMHGLASTHADDAKRTSAVLEAQRSQNILLPGRADVFEPDFVFVQGVDDLYLDGAGCGKGVEYLP